MLIYNNRYIPIRNIICFIVESAGFFFSVLLSFTVIYWKADSSGLQPEDIVFRGILVAISAQFIMYILDLYDLNINLSPLGIFFSAVFTIGFIFITIGLFSLMVPDFGLGGNIYYLTGIIILVFLCIWRLLFERYIASGFFAHNVLIFGAGTVARELGSLINDSKRLGFKLIGYIDKEVFNPISNSHETQRIEGFEDLRDFVKKYQITKIIIASEERRKSLPVKDLLELKIGGVRVIEWPEFHEKLSGKIPVKNLTPSFFLFHEGFDTKVTSRLLCRISSFILSFIALMVCLPLLLITAILIKLDTEGPVIYRQKRVGVIGKTFNLIKFRTMFSNAEELSGAVWAKDKDPRITRIGRYLRKFRIDEITQFINVLMGDMNLVGPRPERPEFVTTLEKELPFYSIRHSIRPGVTGWAQVKFSYSGTIEESREKLEYDLFYLKNRSLKLDLYIILKTLKIVLLGRGAK